MTTGDRSDSAPQPDATEPIEPVEATELVELAGRVRLRAVHHGRNGTERLRFVLVHGLASNARLWDGVADALAGGGHRSVAIDLRGHGRSDKPDGPYDVATVADDLAALCRAVGAERPVLVGQSWGGNVVLEAARRHPELAAGVVCVDGGWIHLRDRFADWDACAAALAPPQLAGTPLGRIEAWLADSFPHWPATGVAGTLANFEILADGTVRPWLDRERHLGVLAGLWDHQPRSFYRELDVPVLLVPAASGLDDSHAVDKAARVDEAASMLPRARVRWFGPPADHDVHAQFPDELAAELASFAAELT